MDFGACPDGKTLNTKAIQAAIDKCAESGGGTVSIPAGVFLSGTFRLRSHVNLQIESGAVLKGSATLADYYLDDKLLGLIFTENAEDITISGSGNIDGNGDAFMVTDKAKKIENASLIYTRQKENFRKVTEGLGDGPVVPKDRPFQMIIFSNCRNVTIRDVLVTNSSFWTIHFADCDGVIVSGIRLFNNLMIPNGDGLDFTSCSNVLVSDCDIRTGDDAIAITGYDHHFNLPGYKFMKHTSENILVTNCNLVSRSSGIRIGGADQNNMKNYIFTNLVISHSNRGIGLFMRDEGSIENMIFSDIVIETRLHTGDWWGQGESIHLSAVRGKANVKLGKINQIRFSNIVCKGASGLIIYGSPESIIENITLSNISFTLTNSPLNATSGGNFDLRPVLDEKLQLFSHDIPGLYAQYVKNLTIDQFKLEWQGITESFFTSAIELDHFEDVRISGFTGSAAPACIQCPPVLIRNGHGFSVINSPGIEEKSSPQL